MKEKIIISKDAKIFFRFLKNHNAYSSFVYLNNNMLSYVSNNNCHYLSLTLNDYLKLIENFSGLDFAGYYVTQNWAIISYDKTVNWVIIAQEWDRKYVQPYNRMMRAKEMKEENKMAKKSLELSTKWYNKYSKPSSYNKY